MSEAVARERMVRKPLAWDNGTKSVIVIAFAVSVASVHMLALNHKADFALVKFAIEALDFIVETSAEDLVLSCQSRAQYSVPHLSLDQTIHLNRFGFEPGIFHSGAHGLPSVFGVRGRSIIAYRVSASARMLARKRAQEQRALL